MNQSINAKVENKISEDLSPTRNLTGLHLKIVGSIAILPTIFKCSPVRFLVGDKSSLILFSTLALML